MHMVRMEIMEKRRMKRKSHIPPRNHFGMVYFVTFILLRAERNGCCCCRRSLPTLSHFRQPFRCFSFPLHLGKMLMAMYGMQCVVWDVPQHPKWSCCGSHRLLQI